MIDGETSAQQKADSNGKAGRAFPLSTTNFRQRRSRLDICFELMEAIWSKGEIKPTQLMYKANLSWRMLSDMIAYLDGRGLVKSVQVGARKKISLTEQGTTCLRRLHEARSALVPAEVRDQERTSLEPVRVFPETVQPPSREGGGRDW